MTKKRFTTGSAALRSIVLFLLIAIAATGATAQNQSGKKSFGIKAGYITENKSATGGLVFQYCFAKHLRIAPQIGVVFRNHNEDALTVDADMQFPFDFANGRADIYPLAGLAFNSWTLRSAVNDKDVNTHYNRLGMNVGVGFSFLCKPSLKVSVEGRYTFVKDFSNTQITAGIAYIF